MKTFELEAKYPFKISYDIKWPNEIKFEGDPYYISGKKGTWIADDCPTMEYTKYGDDDVLVVILRLDGKMSKGY